MIFSPEFQQRYLRLLNVGEERHKRRASNHSSTKENTLICIRAGQASVTYNSASLRITCRDRYSALSTICPHSSYFLFSALLCFLLCFCLVQITIIASKSYHCLEAVYFVHLVIFSPIIPFLPPLSFHSPFITCCLFLFFLILSAVFLCDRQSRQTLS